MIKLRPATMDDWGFLLKLKNDPTMRKFAIVTHKKIEKNAHKKWLRSHVAEMSIILADGEPAGMFRISGGGEVSINILPEFRGQGIGTKVLKKCPAGVWAQIVNGNVPSMKLFLKSGFEINEYEKNYYVLIK